MATFSIGQVLTAAGLNYFLNDSGWVGPSLINSYTGSTVVAYRKIGNRVMLRGGLTSGASNTTAFVLPSGYYSSFGLKIASVSGIAANSATGCSAPVS